MLRRLPQRPEMPVVEPYADALSLRFSPPGERAMPTYISVMNFTDKGIQAVRDSPRRLDAAKKALEDMGGRFRDFFLTMGAYDLVLIYEAPDDAVSARFQLLLGAQGNVRTTTMKAFPEPAYREIIASLG
jgi:uncharacterized protein with GYD domain